MRQFTILLTFALAACSFGDKGEDDLDSGPYDGDDDGYNADVDCDDTDPAVYPDAPEVCDGVDGDCDGESDDDDATDRTSFYLDEDGDGHGGDADTARACSLPEGYAQNDDDCDDDDASVYPGAEEVCGDGIANDCDNLGDRVYDNCLGEGDVSLWDAGATFLGEAGGDQAGVSVARAGDVDQDGLSDLVIGADQAIRDDVIPGAAYLLLGGRVLSGSSGERVLARADLSLIGEAEGDRAGSVVSSAGDVNGDRQSDLLIGAPGEDSGGADAGAAYLLLDGGMLDLERRERNLSEADIKLIGEAARDAAGQALASAGDIDGDDLDDVIIGAPGERDGGAAYILLGGGALYNAMGTLSLSMAEFKLSGEGAGDGAGSATAGAGDVDGDGLADIAVGAPAYGAENMDAAYLLLGGGALAAGVSSLADTELRVLVEGPPAETGMAVAGAGDIDGDGNADLVIGSDARDTGGYLSGSAFVLLSDGALSRASGSIDASESDIELIGESKQDHAGGAVAGAGDVDGDGRDDLLVSARCVDYGGRRGTTYLLLGGGALLGTTGLYNLHDSDHRFISEVYGDTAGISIADGGDINGDELDDIVIGGKLVSATESKQGAAYLFLAGSL